MFRELTTLWTRLQDSEYLHLALESVPLFGLGIGLIFLIVATIFGEQKCRLVALIIIAGSCASVQPYVKHRTLSTPRILIIYDKAFHPAILDQAQRRADSAWYFYGLAALSTATLIFGSKSRFGFLMVGTIVCTVALFLFSAWLHRKECEVFHPNVVRAGPR